MIISSDIKTHVENEEKAHISELLKVNASGDNCELGIGTLAEITMSIRQDVAFATESLGRFLITSITHNLDGTGKYHNTFEGVVSDTERILVKNYDKPNPDMQLADVIDNADPQGNGRIKVKFKWECKTNDVTEWLRVITPDAGSSEKVSKNRGFTFVPEKGDQVVIAFEEGNVARPIVLGSVFHGKNGSGGSNENHLKSIATRSGNKLLLNDNDGSINLMDKGSANLHFDGAGNATTNAATTKTINVGEGKSVVKMDNAGNLTITGETNISLVVAGSMIEITADKISLSSANIEISGGDVQIKGKGNWAGGKIIIN